MNNEELLILNLSIWIKHILSLRIRLLYKLHYVVSSEKQLKNKSKFILKYYYKTGFAPARYSKRHVVVSHDIGLLS